MPRKKVTLTPEQMKSIKQDLESASFYLNNLPYSAVKALPNTLQTLIDSAASASRSASELFNRWSGMEEKPKENANTTNTN